MTACVERRPEEPSGSYQIFFDIPGRPNEIKFLVQGDPYEPPPGSPESKLPSGERIRIGMQRFAAERLKERGLCSYGFEGPDRVMSGDRWLQSLFFVKCLEAPKG